MTKRSKHLDKKDVKKVFQDPNKPSKLKGMTKLKSSGLCFECNMKEHLRVSVQSGTLE